MPTLVRSPERPFNAVRIEGGQVVAYVDGKRYLAGAPVKPGTSSWGKTVDQSRGIITYQSPRQRHPEKSLMAYDPAGGIAVPGFGLLHDEEMKDVIDRKREENARYAHQKRQQQVERQTAFRQRMHDQVESMMRHHRAHAVTDPGTPPHEKKVY